MYKLQSCAYRVNKLSGEFESYENGLHPTRRTAKTGMRGELETPIVCMRILNVIRFVFAKGKNHSGWQNEDCLFRVSVNDVIYQHVAACLHYTYYTD